jgi:hypothetical protein
MQAKDNQEKSPYLDQDGLEASQETTQVAHRQTKKEHKDQAETQTKGESMKENRDAFGCFLPTDGRTGQIAQVDRHQRQDAGRNKSENARAKGQDNCDVW